MLAVRQICFKLHLPCLLRWISTYDKTTHVILDLDHAIRSRPAKCIPRAFGLTAVQLLAPAFLGSIEVVLDPLRTAFTDHTVDEAKRPTATRSVLRERVAGRK